MLSACHTAAELVRKDLIKHFCMKKCQLVKIPVVCRQELGFTETFFGKVFVACVYTHRGVCVIPY